MSDKLAELRKRYVVAMHGVQSAIAYELAKGDSKQVEPKHLRVGINSALVDNGGIATLLIAKGVFTEEEYYLAIAEAAERELESYHRKHDPIRFG
jgi:hypothetical protein